MPTPCPSCSHTDLAACDSPDPAPVTYNREEVKAATHWIGDSNPGNLNKLKGWATGLYRMARDQSNAWYRCTGVDANGNPTGWAPLWCVGVVGGVCRGAAGRPALDFAPGQRRAHGILAERGLLTTVHRILVEKVKPSTPEILAAYTGTGMTVNDAGEFVLSGSLTDGTPATARICPVTKALWIDEVPSAPDDYFEGAHVFADYTIIPPHPDPCDATDAINAALANGNVTLPEGIFYARTSEMMGGSVEVPTGTALTGSDVRVGDDTPGHDKYDRRTILRALPPVGNEDASKPRGTLVQAKNRPKGPAANNQVPQQGATLRNLTVDGNVCALDFLEVVEKPSGSHHGVEWEGVNAIRCEGVLFTHCFDDGLKINGHALKLERDGLNVEVSNGGTDFRHINQNDPSGPSPTVREGMVKFRENPLAQPLLWTMFVPQPKNKDHPVRQLYCTNATEAYEGRCAIADVDNPMRTANDMSRRIGWLYPIEGRGEMEPGHELPTKETVTASYQEATIISNANGMLIECAYEQNGRNGITVSSVRTRLDVQHNAATGNARMAVGIGLEGSFAADVQLATTNRGAAEIWENVVVDGLIIAGANQSGMKIGREVGYRYKTLGPGFYSHLRVRSIPGKAIRTEGFNCGPLQFGDVEIRDVGPQAWTVAHAGGTEAHDIRFNNPRSNFDLDIAEVAYDAGKYAEGVRHVFGDLKGEGLDLAVVRIRAPGVVIKRAERIHFDIVTDPSEPPVELIGPFINCTGLPPSP